jgi:hypothetical protein
VLGRLGTIWFCFSLGNFKRSLCMLICVKLGLKSCMLFDSNVIRINPHVDYF